MITITQVVEKALDKDPFLREILASDYVNISALAKNIKKEVEDYLLKEVNLISIIIALQRIKKKENEKTKRIYQKIFQLPPEITIRSGLAEVVYASTEENFLKITEFSKKLSNKEFFFAFSKGFYEITLILPQNLIEDLKKTISSPKKIFKNLSLISIKLPEEVIDIPGVYYKILQYIAFEKISLIEVFSTFTELMLFVKEENEEKLFKAIRKAVRIL